jgi:hypothetical protein
MRIICILFTLYLSALSVFPCSDGVACADDESAIAVSDEHDAQEEDHCSPFCICACCSAHVQLSYSISMHALVQVPLMTLQIPDLSGVLSDNANTIWQPPRTA